MKTEKKQAGFLSKSKSDFIQAFNHYVLFRMPVFFIAGLIYGHSLVKHAVLSILMLYITERWEYQNLAKAAIIINAQEGLSSLLVVFEAHFADSSSSGRFYVIIFSTISMIAGLMLLWGLDPADNLGIFGGIIFLIAFGEAGKEPTLKAFLTDQLKDEDNKDNQLTDEEKANDELTEDQIPRQLENTEEITSHVETKMENLVAVNESEDVFVPISGKSPQEKLLGHRVNIWWRLFRMLGALSGTFGLRKLDWGWGENWRNTFLTTAIVMASSLLIFLTGSRLYKYAKPKHSRVKSVFRVLRSAFSKGSVKYSNQSVDDGKEMNESDKTSTIIKISSPSSRKREHKQVSEEEEEEEKEVKRLMSMVPMWATFIMYCVTRATGTTFFFEQIANLDKTIGHGSGYTLPPMTFYLMQSFSSLSVMFLANYVISSRWFQEDETRKIAYKIRIGLGLACSCLACVAAMFVEKNRLDRVEETFWSDRFIDMSVFYLTPQFFLLGLAEGLTEDGLVQFFYYQVAETLQNYGPVFNQFAMGLGKLFSIFWILTFKSWIGDNINRSRLDKYYMVLALVNLGNLVVVYTFVSIYIYRNDNLSKLGTKGSSESKGGSPDCGLNDCACAFLCPDKPYE